MIQCDHGIASQKYNYKADPVWNINWKLLPLQIKGNNDISCIFVRERLINMAWRVLSSGYNKINIIFEYCGIIFHPFLQDIINYLNSYNHNLSIVLCCSINSQINNIMDLINRNPESIRYNLSIDPEHDNLAKSLAFIGLLEEKGAQLTINFVNEPDCHKYAPKFEASLLKFKQCRGFKFEIIPGGFQQIRWNTSNLSTTSDESMLPAAHTGKPYIESGYAWCCQGADGIWIDPDGSWRGANCRFAPRQLPLWQIDAPVAPGFLTLHKCAMSGRGEPGCGAARKYADRISAEEWRHKKNTTFSQHFLNTVLPRPFLAAPPLADSFRMRLLRLKPSGVRGFDFTISPYPELAQSRLKTIIDIYYAFADESGKKAWLRAIKSLFSGDSSYLEVTEPGIAAKALSPQNEDILFSEHGSYCTFIDINYTSESFDQARGAIRLHHPILRFVLDYSPVMIDAVANVKRIGGYQLHFSINEKGLPILHGLPSIQLKRAPLTPEEKRYGSIKEIAAAVRVEFLGRLEEAQRAWSIIEKVDSASMKIVCMAECLAEAVEHYSSCSPLPVFALADWDGSANERLNRLAEEKSLALEQLGRTAAPGNFTYCLYGRHGKAFAPGGLLNLVETVARSGILENCGVDAATMAQIVTWRREPKPAYIDEHLEEICAVYGLLEDESSRRVFIGAVKSILTGDPSYLPLSAYPQYMHPNTLAESGDAVIEGGVCDGLTTIAFSQIVGPNGNVTAFEPLPRAYRSCLDLLRPYANVKLENLGLWSGARKFFIADQAGALRLSGNMGEKAEPCHCIDIDSYLSRDNGNFDVLKLDIEGAEMECLKGAEESIGRHQPKMHISIYHGLAHYLEIPLWIHSRFPGYKLYMGHHFPWYYETCLYAAPSQARNGNFDSIQFSIIIPVYNGQSRIAACIDSVLAQDVPNIEIIVVDDGSTDGTGDIIKSYAQRYPDFIKHIRFAENRGPGAARNAGMDLATGKYVAFVDSDDRMADHFLSGAGEIMESQNADIAAFGMLVYDLSGKPEAWKMDEGEWRGPESLRQLLLKRLGGYASYARLYRRAMLRRQNIRYSETRVHQDMFFSVQAFYYSNKTVGVNRIGYHRVLRRNSHAATTRDERHFLSFLGFVRFLTQFFEDHGLDLESDMYRYCIRRLYTWDRGRVHDFLSGSADIDRLLNKENLSIIGSSPEALRCMLGDASLAAAKGARKSSYKAESFNIASPDKKNSPNSGFSHYCSDEIDCHRDILMSVIVPNFNKSKYLKKCLDSIREDGGANIEILIVDDASTDDSREIAREYASNYPYVHLYCMELNHGQSACQNFALERARGKFIAFVDSDDWICQGFTGKACELLDGANADLAIFSHVTTNSEGEILSQKNLPDMVLPGTAVHKMYLKGDIMPTSWAKAFRKDFLDMRNSRFAEGLFHEDHFFTGSLLPHAKTVVLSNFCAYSNTRSENSIMRPKTYSYQHIRSAVELYDYLRRNAGADPHLQGEISRSHIKWNLENLHLPAWRASLLQRGEVDLRAADYKALKHNFPFLRTLTDLWIKSPLVKGARIECVQPPRLLYENCQHGKPILSVIMRAPKDEMKLALSLNSILGQYLRSIEVIAIINDCNDPGLAFCEKIAAMDQRLILAEIESSSGKLGKAALGRCSGAYALFWDSGELKDKLCLLHGIARLEREENLKYVNIINNENYDCAEFLSTSQRPIWTVGVGICDMEMSSLSPGVIFRRQPSGIIPAERKPAEASQYGE